MIASLLPGRHPFAYGSSDGSIWNMILVYNGVSRLGNPLINEVVIPVGKKDYWNASSPRDDAHSFP